MLREWPPSIDVHVGGLAAGCSRDTCLPCSWVLAGGRAREVSDKQGPASATRHGALPREGPACSSAATPDTRQGLLFGGGIVIPYLSLTLCCCAAVHGKSLCATDYPHLMR